MELSKALDRIAEIHEQIAKGEVYRGWRPLPVACSGLAGFAAAWLQTPALGAADPIGFVLYWTAVAIAAALVGSGEILYNYASSDDALGRRRTRRVVAQLVPSLAAGAVVTVALARLSAGLVPLLPGLWALFFSAGIFACRPYLPRASGFVALFYFLAGACLLWIARSPEALSGWWVGGTFGTGQLLAAIVLYWNLKREDLSPDQPT
jgi:hypothetical protein